MGKGKRKKSLVGWISPDWKLAKKPWNIAEVGVISYNRNILTEKYYRHFKKVRITIEEL